MSAESLVLLVEDDPATARLLTETLKEASERRFQLVHVRDCARAEAALHEHAFDVALLDLGLPDASELEALERLRAGAPELPIVVLTGLDDPDRAAAAVRQGADDYVVKGSINPELLNRVLRHAIERRHYQRERIELVDLIRRSGEIIASELDLERLVQRITDEATNLTRAAFGAFFYSNRDDHGERYTLHALSGAPQEDFARFPHPGPTELFVPTLRGEGVIRLDDVTADPRYGRSPPHYGMPKGHLPVRSYLAVPVKTSRGEVLGGLFFGHPEPGRFDERCEKLAIGVASWAAIAMHNARLFRERLEAIRARDHMVAVVSHDLRGPLQVMDTGIAVIKELGTEDTVTNVIERIERASTSMQRLIDDLVDVAAIENQALAVEPAAESAERIIRLAHELHRDRANGQDVPLALDIENDLPAVFADLDRIEQALGNLVGNALKVSRAGDTVTLGAHRDGDRVVFSVSDQGPGIAPEDQPQLFDRFFRGRAERQRGAGLGLAIVKGIVEAHEGEVWVDSTPGRGSSFRFSLRCAP